MTESPVEVQSALRTLHGKCCWNVSAGGSAGSSFSLAFGAMVARSRPLSNPEADEEYRRFEGECTLLVWCSWRLDGVDRSLASSDQSAATIATSLRSVLKGVLVLRAEARGRACDVQLAFEGGLILHIFCDRLPEDSSDADNWQLETVDHILAVGPGFSVNREAR